MAETLFSGQCMDGDTAQWYARSRYTTNDWDRMKRQRELQEAILTQFNPANILARFQDVAAAGSDIIQTDLPQSMLGYFVDLAVKSRALPVQSADLGRFNVTGKEEDRFVFKVPGLRNVARTAPYFHDGLSATLAEAIVIMGRHQLGVELPPEEVDKIESFLQSLNGELPVQLSQRTVAP